MPFGSEPQAGRPLLGLLLALWLGASLAQAGEGSSVEHYLAQGRFLLESGQSRQALAEFEAAAALPEGQRDPMIHELLARTRFELGDTGGAVESARTAAALGPRMSPELAELHELLTTGFGKVLVIGAAMEGASRPEPMGPLLDPVLKRAFEAGLDRLSAGGEGSTSVYLPVGSYRVSGHIVEIEAGVPARMDLRPSVGVSGAGVYGERRRGPAIRRRPSPPRLPPDSTAPPGGLLLLGGATGYGQQTQLGAGVRGIAAGELGGRTDSVRLHAGVAAGVWRAERLRGHGTAPPAALIAGRLGVVLLRRPRPGLALGPILVWTLGGSRPDAAGLAPGYVGPESYLVHGPEAALRVEVGDGVAPRFVAELGAFLRESVPMGIVLPDDAKPHLSVGAVASLGVQLR